MKSMEGYLACYFEKKDGTRLTSTNATYRSKTGQLAVYKSISEDKLSVLMKLYNESLQKFKKDKDKTCEMIGVDDQHNNPETAAMVVVANAILNLDEVITKN